MQEAAERMVSSGLKELPVLDEAGVLVGFVEEGAVARAYVQALTANKAASRDNGH